MPRDHQLSPRVVSWLLGLLLLTVPTCGQEEPASENLVATMLPLYLNAVGEGLPVPNATTVQINQALDRGDLETANQLLSGLPADAAEASYMKGVVLVATSSFAPARNALERAIQEGPTFAGSERAFYFLGISLMRLGEAEAAREALLAHQAIHPQSAITAAALGNLALQEGKTSEALGHYRKATTQFMEDAQGGAVSRTSYALAYMGMSDAYMQQGNLQDALAPLRSSLEIDPSQAEAWYKLSQIQMQLGMQAEAAKSFREFARLGGVK